MLNLSKHDREKIADAVETDHPTAGCPNTCAVAAALREGYPVVAAKLLLDAIDAPTVAGMIRERTPGQTGAVGKVQRNPPGWDAWAAWSDRQGVYCEGCGAVAYPEPGRPTPKRCGNCLSELH